MKTRNRFYVAFMLIAVFCALLPAGRTWAGAKLSEHRFKDDFENLDERYWTVDKFGGPLVGQALGRLEILIPKTVKGNPFWGTVESRAGFFVKPDSFFDAIVDYKCLRWPLPNNGIRIGLIVTAYDRNNKEIIKLMAGRLSDPDTMCGQNKCSEAYMLYLNGKYYYRETQDKESVLAISRHRFGFNVQAGPLVKEYDPKVPYIGKIWENFLGSLGLGPRLEVHQAAGEGRFR